MPAYHSSPVFVFFIKKMAHINKLIFISNRYGRFDTCINLEIELQAITQE
jgi:hypothetical protein